MSSEDASDDLTESESGIHSHSDSASGAMGLATDLLLDSNALSDKPQPQTASIAGNQQQHQDQDATTVKKANMRMLIERYFYQLLEGCADQSCQNINCKSSGKVPILTPNQAAAKALQLFFQGASLCPKPGEGKQDTKLPTAMQTKNGIALNGESSSDNPSNNKPNCDKTERVTSMDQHQRQDQDQDKDERPRRLSQQTSVEGSGRGGRTSNEIIDENIILSALQDSLTDENAFPILVHKIGIAFSTVENIAGSFRVKEKAPLDHILDKASQMKFGEGGKSLTKEQLRTLEEDQDKDEDSCAEKASPAKELHRTQVDLASVRRSFRMLFDLPDSGKRERILNTLNSMLCTLVECLPFDLQCTMSKEKVENIFTTCIVVMEGFCLARRDFKDVLLISLCETLSHMPLWAQARIAWIWSVHCQETFKTLLELLHELISCQVMSMTEFVDAGEDKIEDNEIILHAVKTMKILFYANILAGEYENTRSNVGTAKEDDEFDPRFLGLDFEDDEESFMGAAAGTHDDSMTGSKLFTPDPLSIELDVSAMDSRKPLIPFAEFCNEVLSEALEMDQDYLHFYHVRMRLQDLDGSGGGAELDAKTSFMVYPFVLTTMKKTLAMYFHSRIRMYSEGRISILHNHLSGQPINPYLKLKVRREHLIEDALIELELLAVNNPKDLKKQLVVEFVGEQGVDEGGVSKEFFQLIVEQIFNPEYGMFVNHEGTDMFWINSTSFENDAQFSLIGIVLGLAIYNNIILAVNFPMVIYRKLMGMRGCFADLSDWNPNLHQSLLKMLHDDESEMEDVYMQSFEISYRDVFDTVLTHELRENGRHVMVTQDNKREFVDLYADFLLNESVEKQFRAFRKGFQMVMAESPLNMLFRPEEVELLVCGSKQFDVSQLHKATEYEHGYTAESRIIRDFWEIVYEMPIELQRKLLEFSTGSDRVPVGGLSNLKLVIARHGPDSDRLPTSHTCYNILLLPEYDSKEKLKDRLLKAISFSQGFGML